MIILGLILLLVGWFIHLSLLYYIGGLLLIIGIVLLLLPTVTGTPVGGRRYWW